jgi:hypothetical protein
LTGKDENGHWLMYLFSDSLTIDKK